MAMLQVYQLIGFDYLLKHNATGLVTCVGYEPLVSTLMTIYRKYLERSVLQSQLDLQSGAGEYAPENA